MPKMQFDSENFSHVHFFFVFLVCYHFVNYFMWFVSLKLVSIML